MFSSFCFICFRVSLFDFYNSKKEEKQLEEDLAQIRKQIMHSFLLLNCILYVVVYHQHL